MDEPKETGRTEAFSDGVFAVAITLLVLSFQPPTIHSSLTDRALLDSLPGQLPMIIAFVTSFATIGIMWINHHRLFSHIKRSDTGLLLLNLLLLLLIVFIPYPTALLAQQYAAHPEGHYAAVLFNGTYFMMAVCFNLLWRYASYHNRLLGKNTDQHAVAAISRQYLFGPISYIITLGLTLINVPASLFLNFILALFFALPPRQPRRVPQRNTQESSEITGNEL
jgi:uncharacterized membrane protein